MRPQTSWLFNLGAEVYGWFTAQPAWRASCERLAERVAAGEPRRIVDLGCGPGVSTFALATRCPSDLVVGIDVAPRMLREARRRQRSLKLGGARIAWVLADSTRLPLRDESVDALAGHSFLYLVHDRDRTLAEARRALRPGGRLVLMEPHSRPATLQATLQVSHDVRHLVSVCLWRPFSRFHGRFSASTLFATLEREGFTRPVVAEVLGGLGLLASAERL